MPLMKTGARYSIERWPLGWLICPAPGENGVPMEALSEALPLFPKKSISDAGIVHHLRVTGKRHAIMCVATSEDADKWRAEILESVKDFDPERRWWYGVDTGASSAALFLVFCRFGLISSVRGVYDSGATPSDSWDFGRCKRLLDLFPSWRLELGRVAEEYPKTAWPKLIEFWTNLEYFWSQDPEGAQFKTLLKECNEEAG